MLKKIDSKNDEQLEAIKDQGKNNQMKPKNIKTDSKPLKTISFFSGLGPEAEKLLDELKEGKNTIDLEKLVCAKFDGTSFNFITFKNLLQLASNIYHKSQISLEDAKKSSYRMFILLNDSKEYNRNKQRNTNKIKSKTEALINAEKFCNNRDNVVKAFKNEVFPFKEGFQKALPDWVKVDKKDLIG